MQYSVYILKSTVTGKYYCGQTNDISNRLKRHNAGEMQSTKHGKPWQMIGYIVVSERADAMLLEKRIKSRGIGRWLEDNKQLLVLIG